MPNADVARVQRRIAKFTDELAGKPMADRLKALGRELQRDAAEAVRETPAKAGTLSDLSMSGWHRGRPVKLATRVTPRSGDGKSSVLVTPDRTAGLWRVLESGRQGYAKGDRRTAGVTRKGNVRRRRVRRTTGATEGKRTWSRASDKMMARSRRELTPKITKVFKATFGTGGV